MEKKIMEEDIKKQIEVILAAPSCYPEETRKSRDLRWNELVAWFEKYGEINTSYNLWGMDRVLSAPNSSFLDRALFRKQRHDINATYYPAGSRFSYDYTILMRDKFLFETFMRMAFGERECYCASEGVLIGEQLYEYGAKTGLIKTTVREMIRRFSGQKIVLKMSYGFSGVGVRVAEVNENQITEQEKTWDSERFFSEITMPNATWLIQKFICQHEVLSQLNETSVNTMRIVTFHTGESIHTSKAVIRFGQKGALLDNVGNGGMLVGTDERGRLDSKMFCSQRGQKYLCPYAGLQIPFYAEAIELVKEAHSFLPGLFTIGWDIAFRPDGPIIVEGNDGWDPNMMQIAHGPMRKLWETMLQKRESYQKGFN